MRKLFRWGKKYIPHLIILLTLLFVLQYLYSYLPIFISFALKHLGDYETQTSLPKFLVKFLTKSGDKLTIIMLTGITMVLLQLVRSIMRFTSNYLTNRITQNIQKDMRISLYDHIVDLSYTYHNNVDTGDLIQRCTSDIDTSASFISNQFPALLDIFATVLIGAYRVYKINVTMMWVSLIILPITAFSSVFFFKYASKLITKEEEKESVLTTTIQENINGARVVKAFQNEKYELDKMERANLDYANYQRKFNRIEALFWGVQDFIVIFQFALTTIVGIILCKEGKLDAPSISACLLLMNMLVWPMRGLGRIVSNFGKAVVASKRIDEVLNEKSEFLINGEEKPVISGNIKFDNVTFKFEDDSKDLLENVSFEIKRGQTVAIVGKTGSGKSTICNLLTRMLETTSGEIFIDSVNIKDIDKKHLRRNIKMVLQDPFLYSKSIYDNVSISSKNLDEKRIYEACKLAAVHDEISSFKSGYKTQVGEKGTTLSGGQKQRLAIARVLVDDAPILIFDDSLSALDTKTDLMIRSALKNKNSNQTTIIITHRITTAKEADNIIVLNNNTVEAIGSHDSLKDKPGLYSELWAIQGELEREFKQILNGGSEK